MTVSLHLYVAHSSLSALQILWNAQITADYADSSGNNHQTRHMMQGKLCLRGWRQPALSVWLFILCCTAYGTLKKKKSTISRPRAKMKFFAASPASFAREEADPWAAVDVHRPTRGSAGGEERTWAESWRECIIYSTNASLNVAYW